MPTFLDRRCRRHEWAAIQRTALATAPKLGDRDAQWRASRDLGYACARLGAFGEARTRVQHALDPLSQLDDQVGEARVRYAHAQLSNCKNDYRQALGEAQQALRLVSPVQLGTRRTPGSALWRPRGPGRVPW